MVWMSKYVKARSGRPRHGRAWRGKVRHGLAGNGGVSGMARRVLVGYGVVSRVVARSGKSGSGKVWLGVAWSVC